jgi:hypothetical protein
VWKGWVAICISRTPRDGIPVGLHIVRFFWGVQVCIHGGLVGQWCGGHCS